MNQMKRVMDQTKESYEQENYSALDDSIDYSSLKVTQLTSRMILQFQDEEEYSKDKALYKSNLPGTM